MSGQPPEELFHVQLDQVGAGFIRRFARLRIYIIIFLCILVALNLVSFITALALYRRQTPSDGFTFILFRVAPFYLLISTILDLVQGYFYVTFAKKLRQSMDNYDSAGFNQAMKWLFINGAVTVANLIIVVLYNVAYFAARIIILAN